MAKFLGGMALGIGTTIAVKKFLETEAGKQTQKKAKDMAMGVYDYIAPKIKMEEGMYKGMMEKAAQQFCKMNNLKEESVDQLMKKTNKLWSDFAENG